MEETALVRQEREITRNRQDKTNVLLNPELGNHVFKTAELMCKSGLIPDCYKNRPADVFQVLCIGARLRFDPHTALNQLYVVHGKIAMGSQAALAIMKRDGLIERISYEEKGKGAGLVSTMRCINVSTGEEISESFSFEAAQRMGWTNKGPWKSDPVQMLRYKCMIRIAKAYFPEAILGLSFKEELEDIEGSKEVFVEKKIVGHGSDDEVLAQAQKTDWLTSKEPEMIEEKKPEKEVEKEVEKPTPMNNNEPIEIPF